jgi:hypothetical protein
VVEYLPEDHLHNYTDGIEEINQHSSFQIHLNIPYSGLEELQVF